MTTPRRSTNPPGWLALTGGLLVAVGAMLPWLTLYGGLHGYAGISGLYGRLLLAIGIVATALAVLRTRRNARVPAPVASTALIGLGVATASIAVTRLAHTRALVSSGEFVMLVPEVGPGLFVVLIGSALLAAGGFARWRVS